MNNNQVIVFWFVIVAIFMVVIISQLSYIIDLLDKIYNVIKKINEQ